MLLESELDDLRPAPSIPPLNADYSVIKVPLQYQCAHNTATYNVTHDSRITGVRYARVGTVRAHVRHQHPNGYLCAHATSDMIRYRKEVDTEAEKKVVPGHLDATKHPLPLFLHYTHTSKRESKQKHRKQRKRQKNTHTHRRRKSKCMISTRRGFCRFCVTYKHWDSKKKGTRIRE